MQALSATPRKKTKREVRKVAVIAVPIKTTTKKGEPLYFHSCPEGLNLSNLFTYLFIID